jgi:hypothetical protein
MSWKSLIWAFFIIKSKKDIVKILSLNEIMRFDLSYLKN